MVREFEPRIRLSVPTAQTLEPTHRQTTDILLKSFHVSLPPRLWLEEPPEDLAWALPFSLLLPAGTLSLSQK